MTDHRAEVEEIALAMTDKDAGGYARRLLTIARELLDGRDCPKCKGYGEVMGVKYANDTPEQVPEMCNACGGSGQRGYWQAKADRLVHILEVIDPPDNIDMLPVIIHELKTSGGEWWAAGEALERLLAAHKEEKVTTIYLRPIGPAESITIVREGQEEKPTRRRGPRSGRAKWAKAMGAQARTAHAEPDTEQAMDSLKGRGMTGEQRCSQEVVGPHNFHPCYRRGEFFESDLWWCKQHAPSTRTWKKCGEPACEARVPFRADDLCDHHRIATLEAKLAIYEKGQPNSWIPYGWMPYAAVLEAELQATRTELREALIYVGVDAATTEGIRDTLEAPDIQSTPTWVRNACTILKGGG